MKSQIITKIKVRLVLLLILLTSAVFRFFRIFERFVFTFDEEYQALLAKTITFDFHLIWIGVSASDLNFYLGPFWTYLTALLFFFSGNKILITALVAAVIGIGTTLLIFFAGRSINLRTGLTAALLYAVSPLMVFYDQRFWNPTLIPAISMIIFLVLSRFERTQRWWFPIGLILALIFHTHLSLMPFFALVVVFILFHGKKISWQEKSLTFGFFLLGIFPLVVFDFVHNQTNIKALLNFFGNFGSSMTLAKLISNLTVIWLTFSRVWWVIGKSAFNETVPGCAKLATPGFFHLSLLSLIIFIYGNVCLKRKLLIIFCCFFLLSAVFLKEF